MHKQVGIRARVFTFENEWDRVEARLDLIQLNALTGAKDEIVQGHFDALCHPITVGTRWQDAQGKQRENSEQFIIDWTRRIEL